MYDFEDATAPDVTSDAVRIASADNTANTDCDRTTDLAVASLAAVNARFNAELARQIAGTLPPGHIYQL